MTVKEGIIEQIDELRNKISGLEKKQTKDHKFLLKRLGVRVHKINYTKEIAELKKQIGEIDKILVVITEGRVLELKVYENLEEILRDYFTEVSVLFHPNNTKTLREIAIDSLAKLDSQKGSKE